jgi:hypothetical protein
LGRSLRSRLCSGGRHRRKFFTLSGSNADPCFIQPVGSLRNIYCLGFKQFVQTFAPPLPSLSLSLFSSLETPESDRDMACTLEWVTHRLGSECYQRRTTLFHTISRLTQPLSPPVQYMVFARVSNPLLSPHSTTFCFIAGRCPPPPPHESPGNTIMWLLYHIVLQ